MTCWNNITFQVNIYLLKLMSTRFCRRFTTLSSLRRTTLKHGESYSYIHFTLLDGHFLRFYEFKLQRRFLFQFSVYFSFEFMDCFEASSMRLLIKPSGFQLFLVCKTFKTTSIASWVRLVCLYFSTTPLSNLNVINGC